MNINVIAAYSRCVVLETEQESCCFAPRPFAVWVDGQEWGSYETNVFTLFGLEPDCTYEIRVSDGEQEGVCTIQTTQERVLLDVRSFGAVGDGTVNCTTSLQAALCACPPGGTVYVPAGVYQTGPLFLQSHVTLYLEKDATLLGLTDRNQYPVLPGMVNEGPEEYNLGTWEGNPLDCYASLLTAVGVEGACVCGQGTVNGNADHSDWWEDAKVRRGAWRPRMVFWKDCTDMALVGITVCNSPSWTVHPYYCKNVDILGVTVRNPDTSPNTDGIDPECCTNVRIIGATVSVGDDCISIKSGKYYMALNHPRESSNVTVRNCLLERGHGAVVVGSEISAGVRNVEITRCLMKHTDRGLRVKTRRGRGKSSVVENIVYENVRMERVLAPFVINMFYFCDPDGLTTYVSSKEPLPVDDMTPCVASLKAKNIVCEESEQAATFFYGLPEQPIGLVDMENIHITFAEDAKPGIPAMMEGVGPLCRAGIFAANVKTLRLKNVRVEGHIGETLVTEGAVTVVEE